MHPHPFVAYRPPRLADGEMQRRADAFRDAMAVRRSVRHFSPDAVPRELVEAAVATAASAPSGANRQPWRFVVVGDPAVRRRIREAAEREERENYEGGRLPEDWLEALRPLGTWWQKPYLEVAPWLVIVFEERYAVGPDGEQIKNYYVKESVGIACGLFIAALHQMGLATVPHTPSPMAFLRRELGRPVNERAFALFPVGHPASDCEVPDLRRKSLDEVMVAV